MFTANPSSDNRMFNRGQVVSLAKEMAGVQVPAMGLVPADKLGPGLVGLTAPDGTVCVQWPIPELEACLPGEDLRPMGANARLVIVRRYDKRGVCSARNYKLVTGMGLLHNWSAELRPNNLVRTIREDGLTYTFTVNPLYRSISSQWDSPRDDDDAEALTVAELTL